MELAVVVAALVADQVDLDEAGFGLVPLGQVFIGMLAFSIDRGRVWEIPLEATSPTR